MKDAKNFPSYVHIRVKLYEITTKNLTTFWLVLLELENERENDLELIYLGM